MLDAHILVRAALGVRVRQLIERYAAQVDLFAPDVAFVEPEEYLPRLYTKRGLSARPAMEVFGFRATPRRKRMNVTTDATYIGTRTAAYAAYERERDLSLKRKERNEYKEGEFERVRDGQRAQYVAAMGRAYAEFLEREAREATAAPTR